MFFTRYMKTVLISFGMKKFFPTFFDLSAEGCDTVIFSAGQIGAQIEITLAELSKVISFGTAELCREEQI